MINRVKRDDGLEEVKAKLNEIIDVIVFDNPMERVEQVAQKHLKSHNREIATTRDELKETLVEVKEKLEAIDNTQKDVAEFKTNTQKDVAEFKTNTQKDVAEFKTNTQKDVAEFKTNTQKDVAEFKESVNNIVNNIQEKIRQFITFYAQVGIHVKELCDGKK